MIEMYKKNLMREYYLLVIFFVVIISFCADIDNRLLFSWLPAAAITLFFIYSTLFRKKVDKGIITLLGINISWVLYSTINISEIKSPNLHIKSILEMLFWICFFYLTFYRVDRVHKSLSRFLLTVVTLFIVISVFQYVNFSLTYSGRRSFSGFFYNRNDFAVLASFFLALQVFLGKNKTGYLKQGLLIALIFVTFSTKGIFSIAIIYFFYFKNNFSLLPRILLISIFGGAFLLSIMTNELMLKRVVDKLDSLTIDVNTIDESSVGSSSAEIRVLLYLSAIDVLKENPYFGVGVNNAQFYMPIPDRSNLSALNTQNNYSEMALNAGIPGFIMYYLPFILLMIFFSRKDGYVAALCSCLLYTKFFNDTGMKSYNEAVQLVAVVFVYYIYFNRNLIK